MVRSNSAKQPDDTSLVIYSAGAQIDGQRDYQEDTFSIHEQVALSEDVHCTLAVLCDGMGGHAGGQVASLLACQAFYTAFAESSVPALPERLRAALDAANEAIGVDAEQNPERTGMGTTLVAAVIMDHLLHWISVGDSPLWLRSEKDLIRLNADHSLAPVLDKLAEMGEITPEQAARDRRRNQLRSALVGAGIEHVDLPEQSVVLAAGNDVVLASDGVETLSVEELAGQLVENRAGAQAERVHTILEQVALRQEPGQDNATLIIMHCEAAAPAASSLRATLSSLLQRKA